MPFEIVLYQPQIPQNTGNVVRTCAVTGCQLALIEPLGFAPTDRRLKRAGLDYWLGVEVTRHSSLPDFLESRSGSAFFFSSKAAQSYSEASYAPGDLLIFGSETAGLPQELHIAFPERFFFLPMLPGKRCLNLASAVSAVTYEAWRQNGFISSE